MKQKGMLPFIVLLSDYLQKIIHKKSSSQVTVFLGKLNLYPLIYLLDLDHMLSP